MSKIVKGGLYFFGALFVFVVGDRMARPAYYKEFDAKMAVERAAQEQAEARRAAAKVEAEAQKAAEKTRTERIGTDFDARFYAKEFMKRVLKAPKSAEFSEDTAVWHADDSWSVKGYVDSQNSFGAMLRSIYLCRVKKEGTSWTLLAPCEVVSP